MGFTVGYFQMLLTPFTVEYHQQTHLPLIPACSLFSETEHLHNYFLKQKRAQFLRPGYRIPQVPHPMQYSSLFNCILPLDIRKCFMKERVTSLLVKLREAETL